MAKILNFHADYQHNEAETICQYVHVACTKRLSQRRWDAPFMSITLPVR